MSVSPSSHNRFRLILLLLVTTLSAIRHVLLRLNVSVIMLRRSAMNTGYYSSRHETRCFKVTEREQALPPPLLYSSCLEWCNFVVLKVVVTWYCRGIVVLWILICYSFFRSLLYVASNCWSRCDDLDDHSETSSDVKTPSEQRGAERSRTGKCGMRSQNLVDCLQCDFRCR